MEFYRGLKRNVAANDRGVAADTSGRSVSQQERAGERGKDGETSDGF